MLRTIYVTFFLFLYVSGCASTNKERNTVLYPAYELAGDAKFIILEHLPNSACFGKRGECFTLSYAANKNNDVMYVLLEKDHVKRVYKFFTKTIDNVFVKGNKLFIVFVDQTELYGWIEYENGDYLFRMFSDPEL